MKDALNPVTRSFLVELSIIHVDEKYDFEEIRWSIQGYL